MPRLLLLAFALNVATVPIWSASAVAATDRQSRLAALPAGRALSIDVTIGDVRVEGEARTDAAIEIVRTAPTAQGLGRIPVRFEESDDELRLVAVQADGGTDAGFRTNVTVRVPHAATLRSIRIVEGALTLALLRGALTADVRRGPIDATDVQGAIRLETEIGHITAKRMRLTPNGLLRLRTFNGDVRLGLAERPADARIMALALNGTIQSEIPLTMKDRWGPRWGEATLGAGEPVISIDVVTGRVEITVE